MKGFTLLEILVASGAAFIIGVLLLTILVNNNGFFNQQAGVISKGLSLNDTMSTIDGYIRQASVIASGYPEVSPTYISGAQTLVLKLPAINAQGTIEGASDYFVITKDPSKPAILRAHIFPDPQSSRVAKDQVLTTLLQTVQFKYLDKAGAEVSPASAVSVEISMTVVTQAGLNQSTRTATGSTSLRNL
ncbi:MAG: hypothetical protein V1808_02675 [Candidatus Daviesbacteria bacterium]